jgi:CHAT domain-containing protein/tetratricopeptide (TPR) repeat protein
MSPVRAAFGSAGRGVLTLLVLAWLGCAPTNAIAEADKSRADALLKGLGDEILQGHTDKSLKTLDEALQIYRQAGDRRGEASCHLLKGLALFAGGDKAGSTAELETSLTMRQELGDRFDAWQILWLLAETDKQEGRLEKARTRLEEALGLLQEIERSSEPLSLDGFRQLGVVFGAPAELLDMSGAMAVIAKPILLLYAGTITNDSLGAVFVDTGPLGQAEKHLEKARELGSLFAGLFDSSIFAHLGDLRRRQSRFDEAKENYQKALTGVKVFSGLPFVRDARLEVQALARLAEIDSLAGRLSDALRWNDQALALVRQGGDRKREAAVLQDRADLYLHSSRLGAAEEALKEALGIAQQTGDVYRQASLFADLGNVAMQRGSYPEAAGLLERSVALFHNLHEPYVETGVWSLLSEVYLLLEARGGASGTLEEARKRAQESQFRAAEELADTLDAWGRFRSGRASLNEVRTRLEGLWKLADAEGLVPGAGFSFMREMLTLMDGSGQPGGSSTVPDPTGSSNAETWAYFPIVTRFLQGRLKFQNGEFAAARALWSPAVEEAQKLGNKDFVSGLLAAIGVAYLQEGKPNEAIEQLVKAVKILEENATTVRVEELLTSYLGSERRWYYELLVEMLVRQGQTKEAFEYAERARARAFLNLVGNRRLRPGQGADAKLVADAETLRAAIAALERPDPGHPAPNPAQTAEDLKEARRRFEALQVRLKVSNPEYSSLVAIEPLQVADIQREIAPGTTMISYFLTSIGAHAWVLDRGSFHYVALPLDSKALSQVRCWAKEVQHARGVTPINPCNPEGNPEENLYRVLIAPLRDKIQSRRLVVIPHGVLHYIPFAALRDPQTGHYLVEDYTLTYAPSASALRFLRGKESPIAGKALVLGNPANPAPELPPLPGAEKEAALVAQALGTTPLVGRDATENLLYHLDKKVDLVHIAAHGIYDSDNPSFSRIALAPGAKQDGNLELHEILADLDLSGVNLVVLSACQTAIGERSGGDEIVGLTRGLLYAGSSGVISTLWDIDDEAAAILMAEFYRLLLSGTPVAEALQQAQLALLRSPRFKDPSYWAAFSLAGDPQGRWKPAVAAGSRTEGKIGGPP